jgi:signal transduction histidine kinase
MVGSMMDITDQKKAEGVIKQINKELHELSAHLQTVREEERLQIARDIHDELGQQLTGLKLGIEWLSIKIANEDILLKEKINEMVALIKVTIQAVRRISSNLRPSMLDDLGLVAALEWQSQEVQKRSGITISFKHPIQEPDLPIVTSTALFRIYQEALTNVVRHATASEVESYLQIIDDNLILIISDNGIGMNTEKNKEYKSFGLIGIKERAFAIGGTFDLESQPGKGTTIKITVHI